jgi:hypothetical protein
MSNREKAVALCDKIGLTDALERGRFIMGYEHGCIDTMLDVIEGRLEALSGRLKAFPDAETR